MSIIGDYIKQERKRVGLTQEEFAIRSGLGLRFVRELEQGKETVRLDKVNQALAMFGERSCTRGAGAKYLTNPLHRLHLFVIIYEALFFEKNNETKGARREE